MEDISGLTELKTLILNKARIPAITPGDCKNISREISKDLNKSVSETTLKRLFGFASMHHHFSTYTLTALSEYAGKKSVSYNGLSASGDAKNSAFSWKNIHDAAVSQSKLSLKCIRNRSEIPFGNTISRSFAESDFLDFFESEYSFMTFISPPGFGRTILMGHLAEKILQEKIALAANSTLFFVAVRNMVNEHGICVNFEDQLKGQLGISRRESLIDYANQHYQETGGKLVIFIDGLAELALKSDRIIPLFDAIVKFLVQIGHQKSIKLVMSMRSTTWNCFKLCMQKESFLEQKWFNDAFYKEHGACNVPLLSEQEVAQILSGLGLGDVGELQPDVKNLLSLPVYMQSYVDLIQEGVENPDCSRLICTYINTKVYRSNYSTEKVYFLKRLMELTGYGTLGNAALKEDLVDGLLVFKNAYKELLCDGILMEDKGDDHVFYKRIVSFVHQHIYDYFVSHPF